MKANGFRRESHFGTGCDSDVTEPSSVVRCDPSLRFVLYGDASSRHAEFLEAGGDRYDLEESPIYQANKRFRSKERGTI